MHSDKYIPVLLTAIAAASICSCSNDDMPGNTENEAGKVSVTVIDYSPAPGQFINIVPKYENGDSYQAILRKAGEALSKGDYISLGAWGGSITLKLDKPITNASGQADFAVLGNAYYTSKSPDGRLCGSSEPGIIQVMKDSNGNGLPDDGWCEIPGSVHSQATSADYSVTYTVLGPQHITWSDNEGNTGVLYDGSQYHQQSFVPQWISNTSTMTFTGRRLPDNGFYDEASMQFKQYVYDGYADCRPNNDTGRGIDISDAVDISGTKANLDRIDFVRIYTGVLQVNGAIGECSTEVAGVEALH